MTRRACPSCPDGYVWTQEGPTGAECPTCKGKAYIEVEEEQAPRPPVTIERQIAAVRHEIAMRRHIYPRWVNQGKITKDSADKGIEAMEAVRDTLERVREEQAAKVQPRLI